MFRLINLWLIFSLLIVIPFISYSQQQLYIPYDVQSAYTKGTRNLNGMPGENYWQNSADYIIEAELDPAGNLLTGKEQIKYYNNSPDSLRKIVIRLYQEFYRSSVSRDFDLTPDYITNGVKIISIKINGEAIDINDSKILSRSGTNMLLFPSKSVPPNSSIDLEIEWSFNISPGRPIRMGRYDSTTYFIAYWYPQVSVYDDISGWDESKFGGEKEFYNDFNNYDVKITVPAGVGVWATGTLQNPEDVLNEKFYQRYTAAQKSDSIINIIREEDLTSAIYKNINGKNTFHFKGDYITDFAFATSSHYLWDASSIRPDPSSEKRTYAAAVYRKSSKDFYQVAEITRDIIKYFSTELPGVPFPYLSLTVFNGSGGMEFPMMINDGSETTIEETIRLTSHEAAHQYFPFYMGTNERKYAFMDEGFAVMIPFDFQQRNGADPRAKNAAIYENFAGNELEVPPIIPSLQATGTSYRIAAYNRPGCAYDILQGVLGKEKFRLALQEFISRWNGKHPIPYDLFYTFNDAAGENLNWFWQTWFFDRGYPDLAIRSAEYAEGMIKVTIEKKGTLPVPIALTVYGNDDERIEILKDASVWKNNETVITLESSINFIPVEAELGNDRIPDKNKSNNFYLIEN